MDDAAPNPPEGTAPKTQPDLKRALLTCVGFGFLFLLVVIPAYAVIQQRSGMSDGAVTFAAVAVSLFVAWPVTLLLAVRTASAPWRECYPFRSFSARIVAPLVLLAIGSTILMAEIVSQIPMPESTREYWESLADAPVAVSAFVGLLVAPFAEEMFFRGWMLRGFLAHYSVRKAVWASAILFASVHLNPWQGVIALAIGLFNAWLVLRTHSLWPGIIVHATVNGAWPLTSWVLQQFGYSAEALEAADHVPIPALVAGAVLAAAGWLLLRGRVRETHGGAE